MLGQPIYNRGDEVKIIFRGDINKGEIYIVDAYGTFEQNEEPSYVIIVF